MWPNQLRHTDTTHFAKAGAAFIIVLNIVVTAAICYLIKLFIPLRMSDEMLRIGDHAVHGEEAYGLAEEDDADELVPA